MGELKTAWKGISKYFVCSVLTCYAICIHFGFHGWILYSPDVLIYFFFNVSEPEQLPDPTTQMFFLELAIDLYPLGGLIGSLLSGYMGDRFGRKGSIMIINFLSFISVILLACDRIIYMYEFTICAHLLTGICAGVKLCLMYLYLCEIAPRTIRGGVIMLTDFFVKLGNIIAQIVSFPKIIEHQKGWFLFVFLAGITPLALMFLLPRIPESPRYLLIQMEDEQTARHVLQRLKVSGDVEEEIEELQQENLSEKEEKKTNIIHLGKISGLSWPLFSMVVIMSGSQFVGFHELYYHNYKILLDIKMEHSSMRLLKISTSVFLCFTSLLATYLIDYLGRRILFLLGLTICTIILILVVVVLELLQFQITTVFTYFCVSLLVIFIASYSIGPNVVSIIISLELFLQSARASAFAISGTVYCLTNILLNLIRDKMKKKLGSYALLVFGPFCVATLVFVYIYIPETKNQTFKDIKTSMAIQRNRKIHVKTEKAKKELEDIL